MIPLGSPAHAAVVASATGFGPEYLMVPEDLGTPMPNSDGPNCPDMVRADMAYIPIAEGGEIFSVGSIGFVGAMAWIGFHIARRGYSTMRSLSLSRERARREWNSRSNHKAPRGRFARHKDVGAIPSRPDPSRDRRWNPCRCHSRVLASRTAVELSTRQLEALGLIVKRGTLVDATMIAAAVKRPPP